MTTAQPRNPEAAFLSLPRVARERAYQVVRAQYGPSERINAEMLIIAHMELM
jgi:hypothetical protein